MRKLLKWTPLAVAALLVIALLAYLATAAMFFSRIGDTERAVRDDVAQVDLAMKKNPGPPTVFSAKPHQLFNELKGQWGQAPAGKPYPPHVFGR